MTDFGFKNILRVGLIALMFLFAARARAVATMRISVDGGVTWTNIVDNGPLDQSTDVGTIVYQADRSTPFSGSYVGSALHSGTAQQLLDLDCLVFSASNNLIIQFSDSDFGPVTGYFENDIIGFGNAPSPVTCKTFCDPGNELFSGTNLASLSGLQDNFGATTYSPVFRLGLYSLTTEARLTAPCDHSFVDVRATANPPSPPVLLYPALSDNGVNLSFQTQSGFIYDLEYKNSLGDAQWTVLQSVPGSDSAVTLIDSSSDGHARLYRVNVR